MVLFIQLMDSRQLHDRVTSRFHFKDNPEFNSAHVV